MTSRSVLFFALLAALPLQAATVSTQATTPGTLDGLAVDADGTAYVSTAESGRILRVAVDGTQTELFRAAGQYFVGVARDGNDVLAAEFNRGALLRIRDGQASTVATGITGAGDVQPDNQSDAVFVAATAIGQIVKIAADGTRTVHASGIPTVLGLAQDGTGVLYAAGLGTGDIVRIDASGPVRIATLSIPGEYKIGHLEYAGGYLFATGIGDNRVYRVSTSGEVKVIAGSAAPGGTDGAAADARFNGPNGIALRPGSRELFISEYSGGRLRKLTLDAADVFAVNPGMGGFWYDPSRAGQGFSFEVIGDQLALAWYTYAADGSPHWYTANGTIGGDSANLTLFLNQGGRLNDGPSTESQVAGSASVRFNSCSSAVIEYNISGLPAGQIALSRLGSADLCVALAD